DCSRRKRRDVTTLVEDASASRGHELGEEIKTSRLAGAIRPDQRMDRAARNAQIDPIDRDETGQFFVAVVGLEDKVIAHSATALLVRHSGSTARRRQAKKGRGFPAGVPEPKKAILMRRKRASRPQPSRLRLPRGSSSTFPLFLCSGKVTAASADPGVAHRW